MTSTSRIPLGAPGIYPYPDTPLRAFTGVRLDVAAFVGVAPRSRDEVDALSRDWRSLYLRAKAGLVTEAELLYGRGATDDELYASEAFYSVAASPLHDVRLLGRYVATLLGLGHADRAG